MRQAGRISITDPAAENATVVDGRAYKPNEPIVDRVIELGQPCRLERMRQRI
jgi:hypothetical protein